MSGTSDRPDGGGQLREEAAGWFARMRGPDADYHRADFDQWLARGALHRAAYNRVAGVFADGKHLKEHFRLVRRRRLIMLGAGALSLAAIVPLVTLTSGRQPDAHIASVAVRSQAVSVVGQVRYLRLSDGSRVILDSDSLVAVRFDGRNRVVDLRRGRARFEIAHEARPFSVSALDVRVVARGTQFDVSLGPGENVDVQLLRGVVDVERSPLKSTMPTRQITLRAGQSFRRGSDGRLAIVASPVIAPSWPSLSVAFDRVRLSEVVAQANRYSVDKIVVQTGVDEPRVSGRFRIDDPVRVAEHLASLFDLEVDRRTPGIIVLRGRPK